jgi:hypothetical protein
MEEVVNIPVPHRRLRPRCPLPRDAPPGLQRERKRESESERESESARESERESGRERARACARARESEKEREREREREREYICIYIANMQTKPWYCHKTLEKREHTIATTSRTLITLLVVATPN